MYSEFRVFERTPSSWWVESTDAIFQLVEEDGVVVRVDGDYLPSTALIEFLRAAAATGELRLVYDRRFPDDFVERCLLWKKIETMQRTAVKGGFVKAQLDEVTSDPPIDYLHFSRRLDDLLTRGYLEIGTQEEPNRTDPDGVSR
jgi:hypothetical protein